jgi:hypothetical protein
MGVTPGVTGRVTVPVGVSVGVALGVAVAVLSVTMIAPRATIAPSACFNMTMCEQQGSTGLFQRYGKINIQCSRVEISLFHFSKSGK